MITRAARSRISRFIVSAPVNEPDPATFYGGDAVGYTDYPVRESHRRGE
jgi:N-ethylmaleimide reductase